jgi:hypothetical protein
VIQVVTLCVQKSSALSNKSSQYGHGAGKLPATSQPFPTPESGRGAAWLTEQMKRLDSKAEYKKPGDAMTLTQCMDLDQCRANSPSFDKLCRDLKARVPQPPVAPEAEVPA